MLCQIAIYGKGGIGKSTIASGLASALAAKGKKVALVGCDPKCDSTMRILGRKPRTVMDIIATGEKAGFTNIGFGGVQCIEAGGPEPGVGCAGRGIILAIEALKNSGFYKESRDYIIYDVLGDVVCGGFAVPIREGFAEKIFLVTSGEFMSLFAANNICRAIERYSERGKARLGGVIANLREPRESTVVRAFASRIGSSVMAEFKRDSLITKAEANGKTVLEDCPGSEPAKHFRKFADQIVKGKKGVVPKHLDDYELETLYRKCIRQ